MKLIKLYTTPTNLFNPIKFHNGINIIFGVKTSPNDSLNSIGKSLLLDFLNFALLSDFNLSKNTRLNNTYHKTNIQKHSVNLEFQIGSNNYKIIRSFNEPQKATLFTNGTDGITVGVRYIQSKLFDLIYNRDNYPGHFDSSWFNRLTKFFLKIQKVSDQKFIDPIRYTYLKEIELNQYHLFLLNLDNSVVYKNLTLTTDLADYRKTIKTTKNFLEEHYSISNISAAQIKVLNLQKRINSIEKTLNNYQLRNEYKELNNRANQLTSELKNLFFLNAVDTQKINEYNSSITHASKTNIENVASLYEQFGSELALKIKVSLEEAKQFRSALTDSRKDFVAHHSNVLQNKITLRQKEIASLELQQRTVIRQLASRKALQDLQYLYQKLNTIQSEKVDLESKVRMFKDLASKINDIITENEKLLSKIDSFISDNSQAIKSFTQILSHIYTSVFGSLKDDNPFAITKTNDEQKLKIEVLLDDVYSHGKNQGRTLVYDLAILFNAIENNIPSPRFLVHDGIFDALDISHFISLIKFCAVSEAEGKDFQYIVTFNDRADFDAPFNKEKSIRQVIHEKQVIEIDSTKKLLGLDF